MTQRLGNDCPAEHPAIRLLVKPLGGQRQPPKPEKSGTLALRRRRGSRKGPFGWQYRMVSIG